MTHSGQQRSTVSANEGRGVYYLTRLRWLIYQAQWSVELTTLFLSAPVARAVSVPGFLPQDALFPPQFLHIVIDASRVSVRQVPPAQKAMSSDPRSLLRPIGICSVFSLLKKKKIIESVFFCRTYLFSYLLKIKTVRLKSTKTEYLENTFGLHKFLYFTDLLYEMLETKLFKCKCVTYFFT